MATGREAPAKPGAMNAKQACPCDILHVLPSFDLPMIQRIVSQAAWVLFALALLVSLPSAPEAAVVEGLYVTQVEVADDGRQARERAYRRALREVLVRVTGDSAIMERPAAATILDQASRAVQQFSYVDVEDGEGSADEEQKALRVRFDARLIQRLVKQNGLPFWGSQRPAVLAWVAVDDGSRRYLVGEQTDAGDTVARWLFDAADQRGIPVLLPLMDLQDQRTIRFADVWGGFDDVVRQASQRYGEELLATLRLGREGGRWTARWRLSADSPATGRVRGASGEAAMSAAMDEMADVLGGMFAVTATPGDGRFVEIVVHGIRGVDALAETTRYLESLDLVTDLVPLGVQGEEIRFRLTTVGSREQLERTLRLADHLRPRDGEPEPSPQILHYTYQ